MADPQRDDMCDLMALAPFRRFLWRAIQNAGILSATTDGSEGRHLAYAEGRRNLGFDILADAARGQPVDDPEAAFNLTLFQIIREKAQEQPSEKPNARRRQDRSSELHDDAED